MKQQYKLKASLLALALLAQGGTAKAEQFTLLLYETQADIAARTDKDIAPACWAAYGGYSEALTAAGILRGGTVLPGKTVRASGLGDAPVAASDLELGGYFIIEVADLSTALEWDRKSPGMAARAVEVKPHFVNPAMATK